MVLVTKYVCLVFGVAMFAEFVLEIGPTLAVVLGNLIVSLLTAWMNSRTSTDLKGRLEETNEKLEKAETELALVHTAVNSTASKMTQELSDTKAQVLELSKALVASQHLASQPPAASPTSPVPMTIVQPKNDPVPVKQAKEGEQGL